MSGPYEMELELANEAADMASDVALSLFRGTFEVRRKTDLTPVTEADLRIEARFRELLADRLPDDAVLGEEGGLGGGSGGPGRRTWVIDPIDGTKNFAAGIQVWATLIGLVEEGRPVLGVVSAPGLGERYEAVAGMGARLNGEPIRVSAASEVSEALMLSSGVKDWLEGPLSGPYRELAAASYRTRNFGDFWGHVLVARGAAEMMLEPSLRVWDYTAVQVVVEEAGGRITTFQGNPPADGGSVLTTNGVLHDEVLRRLAAAP